MVDLSKLKGLGLSLVAQKYRARLAGRVWPAVDEQEGEFLCIYLPVLSPALLSCWHSKTHFLAWGP